MSQNIESDISHRFLIIFLIQYYLSLQLEGEDTLKQRCGCQPSYIKV